MYITGFNDKEGEGLEKNFSCNDFCLGNDYVMRV